MAGGSILGSLVTGFLSDTKTRHSNCMLRMDDWRRHSSVNVGQLITEIGIEDSASAPLVPGHRVDSEYASSFASA